MARSETYNVAMILLGVLLILSGSLLFVYLHGFVEDVVLFPLFLVAPPHASSEKKPTLSIFSAIGSIVSVRILVASKLWWASLRVVSVILTGFEAKPINFHHCTT